MTLTSLALEFEFIGEIKIPESILRWFKPKKNVIKLTLVFGLGHDYRGFSITFLPEELKRLMEAAAYMVNVRVLKLALGPPKFYYIGP